MISNEGRPVSTTKFLGVLQLSRPIPLVVWTLGTVTLGAAAAPRLQSGWIWPLTAVLVGGILLQGYITHGLNDFYDWHSGTDRDNRAWLSGGSHAVQSGRLHPEDLRRIALFAIGAYLLLLTLVTAWRGAVYALLGVPALLAGVAYSLPPLRLGYRPLLGEWLGMFPPITAGVLAAGYAAGGVLSPRLWAAAIIYGILCNASVMQHHLADIDLDWQASPQKRTSPAFWQKVIGRPGSEVVMVYALLVFALSLFFSWTVSVRFALTAVLALIAVLISSFTKTGDLQDETRRDALLKGIALANALGFAFFAAVGIR